MRYHKAQPFDFGITLGDNYQDDGPHSPTDPRWVTYWEKHYVDLGFPFYATTGNHDWNNPDGGTASILYASKSPAFRFPSPYYTFTAGPVQFFSINTVLFSEAQKIWLDEELRKSTARWKVVYGHFQIYSAVRGDNKSLIANLLPILKKHKVDMYVCGHEHLIQHMKPEDGVHFFVNGAAGGSNARPARQVGYDRVLWMAENTPAFMVLEADAAAFAVKFVDQEGKQIYEHVFRK